MQSWIKIFVCLSLFVACIRISDQRQIIATEQEESFKISELWQQVESVRLAMGRPDRMFRIDPTKTAMIVVDMQEGFCASGACIEVPSARTIVPNINRLAKACRQAKIPVIWLRFTIRKDLLNSGHWQNMIPKSPSGQGDPQEKLAEGGTEVPIFHEMDYHPEDIVVDKCRYGAFTVGSSNLERILRQMDRDTLLVTGTATDVCCGQTARDASQLDFKVTMIAMPTRP